MSENQFSVLISVYEGDDAQHFQIALESIFEQTVVPSEVVIVADGPLPEPIMVVINNFRSRNPEIVRHISLSTNHGLGTALQTGLKECSYELVARMDADDIALSERFEMQLEHLTSNPDVDVVGSYVGEFQDDPDHVQNVRSVPVTSDKVESMARFRSPTNHPSVMFRQSAVIEAGNYRPLRSMQDYELWVRMLSQGYTIENIPTVLVKCRTGNDLYGRRGGIDYACLELLLQREFLQMGAISYADFLRNVATRVPIRLVPNRIRTWIYQEFFRDGSETISDTSRI